MSRVTALPDHAPMPVDSQTEALRAAHAAFARGEADAALARAHAVLALDPAQREALALAANCAIRLDRPDQAIVALEALLRLEPEAAPVRRTLAALHNRDGGRRRRAGDAQGARKAFERALALDPAQREAGFNLALTLRETGRDEEACQVLHAHLARHRDDAEARLLAIRWRAPGDTHIAADLDAMYEDGSWTRADPVDWALACARAGHAARALEALPRVPAARAIVAALDLVDELRLRGDLPAARAAAEFASGTSAQGRRSPGLKAELARLALPPIMGSHVEIAAGRTRLAQVLAELEQAWTPARLATCEPRLEQLAWGNFYLAYHGADDRELQRAHARLVERAAATFFPQLAEPPAARRSGRIGLLSSSWRDCTAGAYFGGWIDWLREAGHEVHLFQLGPERDARTDALAARAGVFRFHRGPLHELATAIRASGLDLLLYPELGMDVRLLPLAALRLAPRQVVAWGHPVTSGFATLDGFLSCADMEADGADAHYVEPLLRLPGLGVAYARPALPPRVARAALGLPDSRVLALVPQSLFKLHPDDDEMLARFAAEAPTAAIVLFEPPHLPWRGQFERRLARAFAAHGLDPARHLLWLPTGPRERFLQVAQACDLMLDSRRWSGGNTSLDALACGLPIVTCPGATMRARQSAAMLGWLGLAPELVCATPAEFVARAAALAHDPAARASLSRRIGATGHALHDARASRDAFLQHIARLVG